MITVCTVKLKAVSLIFLLIPASVTRAGFILSKSSNHSAQQVHTLPLESLELILHCLATHRVVYIWKESVDDIPTPEMILIW